MTAVRTTVCRIMDGILNRSAGKIASKIVTWAFVFQENLHLIRQSFRGIPSIFTWFVDLCSHRAIFSRLWKRMAFRCEKGRINSKKVCWFVSICAWKCWFSCEECVCDITKDIDLKIELIAKRTLYLVNYIPFLSQVLKCCVFIEAILIERRFL